ncbi:MAG: hypothetical protein NVSMB57_07560 [Actinomycetota bacterium]
MRLPRARIARRVPREWIERTAALSAFGLLWLGWVGAVIGAVGVPAVALGMRRRARGLVTAHADDAIPALLDSVAAAVAAGAGLPSALSGAQAPPALREAHAAYRARLEMGATFEESVSEIASRLGTAQARLVSTALVVGNRSGGDIGAMLRTVSRVARDRRRVEREARAATAQARMSAWVVASLPLVLLFVTGASSKEQTQMLFHTPIGWALLAAGGTLEALGVLWMRKLSKL